MVSIHAVIGTPVWSSDAADFAWLASPGRYPAGTVPTSVFVVTATVPVSEPRRVAIPPTIRTPTSPVGVNPADGAIACHGVSHGFHAAPSHRYSV